MVLSSLGYPSLAMQNEVSSIKNTVVEELYNRFDNIFILQDFDYAGVSGSNRLKKAFGFKPFFIQRFSTRSNGLKDISDFREVNDYDSTKRLIDSYINET
jgi:5S rRNA maturation endonuclease (ribonuclease M5)